jgi:hypothetical protein
MVVSVEAENKKDFRYCRFKFSKSVRKDNNNFKLTLEESGFKSEIRRLVQFKPL